MKEILLLKKPLQTSDEQGLERIFQAEFQPWRRKIVPDYMVAATEIKIKNRLKTFLKNELAYQGQTVFRPIELEKSFSYRIARRDRFQPVLDADNDILIRGVIDRVDHWNGHYLLIDYKSGRAKLRLDDIERGVSLQLPLYALALTQEINKGVPAARLGALAGCELYSLVGGKRQGFYVDGDGFNHIRYVSKRQKPLTPEAFDMLLAKTCDIVQNDVADIERGQISRSPADGVCAMYCPYRQVCRVDRWALAKKTSEP